MNEKSKKRGRRRKRIGGLREKTEEDEGGRNQVGVALCSLLVVLEPIYIGKQGEIFAFYAVDERIEFYSFILTPIYNSRFIPSISLVL